MFEIKFGKVTGPNGEGVPSIVTIDRRDGSPLVRGYPFFDGSGHYDIAPTSGLDLTIEVRDIALKYQGAGFAVSQTQDPNPDLRPKGVTYDPTTGELNIQLPFVSA
jgi:hypothetical protein